MELKEIIFRYRIIALSEYLTSDKQEEYIHLTVYKILSSIIERAGLEKEYEAWYLEL